jgi:nucleoside 2-deoxyribosyltransferase
MSKSEAGSDDKKFYLGMNYNGGGIEIAKKLAPRLESLTGHQCTSRWHHSEAHEHREFRLTIATTDLADIARADYVILAPLTETSRGCHVELGLALGLDKPVYLYRPDGINGTGFDSLCLPWKPEWIEVLKELTA